MRTDMTFFSSTTNPDLPIICEFTDDNSVVCHCYLNDDEYYRALHKFILEHADITVYSVNLYLKTYACVGPSNKVEPALKLRGIPQSFYDDKNVELDVIY